MISKILFIALIGWYFLIGCAYLTDLFCGNKKESDWLIKNVSGVDLVMEFWFMRLLKVLINIGMLIVLVSIITK